MRYLFLNQYFPPDPAPTGVLLAELAAELRRDGAEVELLSAGAAYRAGQGQGGRMRRELGALWQLLRSGLRARRADVILSATSPPCLLVVATLLALWHRARSVHWLMDMYPELAVSLGEVKPGPVPALLSAAMGWCYRRASLVVALDDDMASRLRGYGVAAPVIQPWVFAVMLPRVQALRAESPAPISPWTWIYSGNLGRAHEWQTLLQAQREIEQRDGEIRLVFQGGGPSRAAAQTFAAALGLQRCEWRDYVPEDEVAETLLRCEVCVVTQLPAAQGLLWPSKLGLLQCLPRPVVWVGPPQGAIARSLRLRAGSGVFAPGESAALAAWLLALKQAGPAGTTPSQDPSLVREGALARWRELLHQV